MGLLSCSLSPFGGSQLLWPLGHRLSPLPTSPYCHLPPSSHRLGPWFLAFLSMRPFLQPSWWVHPPHRWSLRPCPHPQQGPSPAPSTSLGPRCMCPCDKVIHCQSLRCRFPTIQWSLFLQAWLCRNLWAAFPLSMEAGSTDSFIFSHQPWPAFACSALPPVSMVHYFSTPGQHLRLHFPSSF